MIGRKAQKGSSLYFFLVETDEYASTYENSEIGWFVLHCLVVFILKLSVSILSVCLLSLFVCCVCQSVSFILCCWVCLLLCVSPMIAMSFVLARQLWSFYLWRKDFGNLKSVTWTLFLYLCICIYVFVFMYLYLCICGWRKAEREVWAYPGPCFESVPAFRTLESE